LTDRKLVCLVRLALHGAAVRDQFHRIVASSNHPLPLRGPTRHDGPWRGRGRPPTRPLADGGAHRCGAPGATFACRWFISQSFEPVEPPSEGLAASINWLASVGESMRSAMAMIPIKAILIVALSAALFSALLVQLYRYVLRPKVVREHLKTE